MTTTHGTAVEIDLPEQNFDAKHELGDIVRLHEYVGSRASQKLIYRVVELPNPDARKKAEREGYAFEPIAGGPRTRVTEAWMLVPGSATDKMLAARTPVVTAKFYAGEYVTTTARLAKCPTGSRLVILDVARDGTVKVTLAGGAKGMTWNKIPVATLTHSPA